MKKIVKDILITLVIGILYFFFLLPPLNITSWEFWTFVIFLLVVYYLLAVNYQLLIYNKFISNKKSNNIIPIIILVLVAGITTMNLFLSPLFNAKKYSQRIDVNEDNKFIEDVAEVNLNALPIVDRNSSLKLGDRVMGQMPELVSQFDVSSKYTQINYNNNIIRVTPLEYNDIFKYLANRKEGIKGYITVNSVTGASDLIKLDKGLKYAESAVLFEDLDRVIRFKYPTKILEEKSFELDENGNPYWIIPVAKFVGVGLRKEIKELIIFDPIIGKTTLYDIKDVPTWVDHGYAADLIIEQVNDWGKYRGGFLNSLIGQKNVVATTEGYNYTVMNDDVYLYTGITSAVADESNIGFVLTNMRTKETSYYPAAGAEEYSAMASAEGIVQHMKYVSTFPLLINLNNKPTYFVSLKDNAGLVKMYGLVDVEDYQKVVVVESSEGLNNLVSKYLTNEKINQDLLIYKNITIANINSAVIENNTIYYIIDTDKNKYRAPIQVANNILPFLTNKDSIKIGYQKIDTITEIKSIDDK